MTTNYDEDIETGYEDLVGKWATIDGKLVYIWSIEESCDDYFLSCENEGGDKFWLDIRSIREVSA